MRWAASGTPICPSRSRMARTVWRCAVGRGPPSDAGSRFEQRSERALGAAPAIVGRSRKIVGIGCFGGRNAVGPACPRAEIDQLATLGAERPPAGSRAPFHGRAALGTCCRPRPRHRSKIAERELELDVVVVD